MLKVQGAGTPEITEVPLLPTVLEPAPRAGCVSRAIIPLQCLVLQLLATHVGHPLFVLTHLPRVRCSCISSKEERSARSVMAIGKKVVCLVELVSWWNWRYTCGMNRGKKRTRVPDCALNDSCHNAFRSEGRVKRECRATTLEDMA